MNIFWRVATVVALGGLAAACGGNDDPEPVPPPVIVPPPVPVAPQEDQFGTAFGAAFRASATAAPVTPADGNIVPLSLTTNPVALR